MEEYINNLFKKINLSVVNYRDISPQIRDFLVIKINGIENQEPYKKNDIILSITNYVQNKFLKDGINAKFIIISNDNNIYFPNEKSFNIIKNKILNMEKNFGDNK